MFGRNKKQDAREVRAGQSTTKPARPTPAPATAEPQPTESRTPTARTATAPTPTPAAPTPATPTRPRARAEATPSQPPADATHIGQTVRIQGELTGNENLIVDGSVEGRIVLPEHSLTIGQHGNVTAELSAKEVVVIGTVIGNIHASERISVLASGSVQGDLHAPKVVLEEGARFVGRVDMVGQPTAAAMGASNRAPRERPVETPERAATDTASADSATEASTPAQVWSDDAPAFSDGSATPGNEDADAEAAIAKAEKNLSGMFTDFDPANP
ncbi:MAG: polymer-forming cytoskeletal protein [Planctomycetes bacterium]|nr:polymer-forming cytoskeletal protein [Planctomycetota bacterium]